MLFAERRNVRAARPAAGNALPTSRRIRSIVNIPTAASMPESRSMRFSMYMPTVSRISAALALREFQKALSDTAFL